MRRLLVPLAFTALIAGCTAGPNGRPGPDPALGQGDFAGAPPVLGRAAPDRLGRRGYYRGPRGHEF